MMFPANETSIYKEFPSQQRLITRGTYFLGKYLKRIEEIVNLGKL